jgi:hypothetical protein
MSESPIREDQPSILPVDPPIDVPGETPPDLPTDPPVTVPSDVPFDPPGDAPATDDRDGVPMQRPPVEPGEQPDAPLPPT